MGEGAQQEADRLLESSLHFVGMHRARPLTAGPSSRQLWSQGEVGSGGTNKGAEAGGEATSPVKPTRGR